MPYKTSYATTERNLESPMHFNGYDSPDGVNNARFKGIDHHQNHHFIVSTFIYVVEHIVHSFY